MCRLIENNPKLPLVSPLWCGCLGQPQHRGPGWHRHCWWPWPLAVLLGTKRSLAPCGELQEIHFSLWFPALGPDKTAQPAAAFRKKGLICAGCRGWKRLQQCQESLVLLPVLTGGNVPLRSCCLVLLAFQPLSCPVALLLQLPGVTLLLSSPFKRVKGFSSVSTLLAKKTWGGEGKWRKQISLLDLACISGRGCKEDLIFFFFFNQKPQRLKELWLEQFYSQKSTWTLFLLVINALADSIE